MKRVIVKYESLKPELKLILETDPSVFESLQLIPASKPFWAVRLEDGEDIYLVKFKKKPSDDVFEEDEIEIEDFDDEDFEDFDDEDFDDEDLDDEDLDED